MKRELQVAFSRRAQPAWFRVIKWALMIWATKRYRHTKGFRLSALGLLAAALTLHAFYRHKTRGWTQAWGGWNDPAFIDADA